MTTTVSGLRRPYPALLLEERLGSVLCSRMLCLAQPATLLNLLRQLKTLLMRFTTRPWVASCCPVSVCSSYVRVTTKDDGSAGDKCCAATSESRITTDVWYSRVTGSRMLDWSGNSVISTSLCVRGSCGSGSSRKVTQCRDRS